MIIPIPAIWRRRLRFEAPDKIDHALDHRTHRLIAGISISDAFDQVRGVLVVSSGRGKFIRVKHCVEVETPITASLCKACNELVNVSHREMGSYTSVIADLAEVQSNCVERIKIEAGKYVDRLMAVSVLDPGIWASDFDGRQRYLSFCDATRLAELCGVSVIDHFPAADLAVNGNGKWLPALPLWLLAADRQPCVSNVERIILDIRDQVHLWRLPPSDGLDAELPLIGHWQWNGNGFHRTTVPISGTCFDLHSKSPPNPTSIESLRSDQLAPALATLLREIVSEYSHRRNIELIYNTAHPKRIDVHELQSSRIQNGEVSSEVTCSDFSNLGVSPDAVDSVVAAILGLMHIDQMPANVPWLTGAESQRILGRLSPGRPSNWRQLIRMMADFKPAAMKLRDAV